MFLSSSRAARQSRPGSSLSLSTHGGVEKVRRLAAAEALARGRQDVDAAVSSEDAEPVDAVVVEVAPARPAPPRVAPERSPQLRNAAVLPRDENCWRPAVVRRGEASSRPHRVGGEGLGLEGAERHVYLYAERLCQRRHGLVLPPHERRRARRRRVDRSETWPVPARHEAFQVLGAVHAGRRQVEVERPRRVRGLFAVADDPYLCCGFAAQLSGWLATLSSDEDRCWHEQCYCCRDCSLHDCSRLLARLSLSISLSTAARAPLPLALES